VIAPLVVAVAALAGAPTVALPTGAVNQRPVLGRRVPQVLAELGAPSSVERFANRRDLVYGPARRPRLEVIFHGPSATPAGQVAWAVLATDPATSVPSLGDVLAVTPTTLESELRTTALRETRSYRCDALGCFGTFLGAGGTRRVIYGIQHGGRYLGVQVWPNPS
jgi:hypothetical protein